MPVRERVRDHGGRRARWLATSIGIELRDARLAAGLSQRTVAHAAGLQQSRISRTERAAQPMSRLDELAQHCAVLGYQLSARPFPQGPPLRDAAHARLLARFQARLPNIIRLRTEVPLRGDREQRAWDGELAIGRETCKLEAETVLHDLQAVDRRIATKMADDHVVRIVLLVADTRRNRRVLREFRALLSERYPLTTEYYRQLIACPEGENIIKCYREAEAGIEGNLGFDLVVVFES